MDSRSRKSALMAGALFIVSLGLLVPVLLRHKREQRWQALVVRAQREYGLNGAAAIADATEAVQLAESHFNEFQGPVLAVHETLVNDPRLRPSLDYSLLLLSQVDFNLSRYSEAEAIIRRRIDLLSKAFGPNHPALARPLAQLGEAYFKGKNYPEAEKYLRSSMAKYRALAAAGQAHERECDQLNRVMYSLEWLLVNDGHYEEADKVFRDGVASLAKSYGSVHAPQLNITFTDYSSLLHSRGRSKEGEAVMNSRAHM